MIYWWQFLLFVHIIQKYCNKLCVRIYLPLVVHEAYLTRYIHSSSNSVKVQGLFLRYNSNSEDKKDVLNWWIWVKTIWKENHGWRNTYTFAFWFALALEEFTDYCFCLWILWCHSKTMLPSKIYLTSQVVYKFLLTVAFSFCLK